MFGPLQGFLNGVVYGVNTKVLVLFQQRFCPWLRMPQLPRCCRRADQGGIHDRAMSSSRDSIDSDLRESTFDERLLSDVRHADDLDDDIPYEEDLHDSIITRD